MVKQHDTMTLRSTDFYWSCPTPMPMLADRETDYEIGRCVGSRCWKKKRNPRKRMTVIERILSCTTTTWFFFTRKSGSRRSSAVVLNMADGPGSWGDVRFWQRKQRKRSWKMRGRGSPAPATSRRPPAPRRDSFVRSFGVACARPHTKKKSRGNQWKKNRLKSAQVRFHTDTTQFGPVKLTRNPAKVQATLRRSMESRLSQTKPSKTQYNSVNSCKTHRNVFQNTVTHQNLKTKLSPVQIRINLSLKTVKLRRNM